MNIRHPVRNSQPNKVASKRCEWKVAPPAARPHRSLGTAAPLRSVAVRLRTAGLPLAGWIFLIGCWTLLVLLIVIPPAYGRVFWRWGGCSDAGRTLQALGATHAYAAPVVLNGRRGELSVYGLDLPLGAALRRIGKALDVPFDASPDASMVIQTVNTPSQRLHLIAIAPPDVTRTLLFVLEQSRSEADRSSASPSPAALPHVPNFPDSAPLFAATNEKARAGLAVAVTVAPVESVLHYYHEQLTGEGWMPALSGRTHGIYLKAQKVCVVQASKRNRQTHIAVFYKELATSPGS